MKKFRKINVDLARAMFDYDPDTGILRRRTGSRRWTAGKVVGCLFETGHLNVSFEGKMTGVHRIAWAIYYGESPELAIDHINGDGADNRIVNLRQATFMQNNRNVRLGTRNKSGIKGVFRVKWGRTQTDKWKWRAVVGHNNEYHITHFHCLGQAVNHVRQLRVALHGEFANNGIQSIMEAV